MLWTLAKSKSKWELRGTNRNVNMWRRIWAKKRQKCKQWKLWTDYFTRKQDESNNCDTTIILMITDTYLKAHEVCLICSQKCPLLWIVPHRFANRKLWKLIGINRFLLIINVWQIEINSFDQIDRHVVFLPIKSICQLSLCSAHISHDSNSKLTLVKRVDNKEQFKRQSIEFSEKLW